MLGQLQVGIKIVADLDLADGRTQAADRKAVFLQLLLQLLCFLQSQLGKVDAVYIADLQKFIAVALQRLDLTGKVLGGFIGKCSKTEFHGVILP